MDNLTTLADKASQQSDRWLFIAALIILGVFGIFIWRWMVADREKLAARLTEITDRHINTGEKLAEVVANNTHALREVSAVMDRCRK